MNATEKASYPMSDDSKSSQSATERMRVYRDRQRRGLRCVRVLIGPVEIDGLIKKHYLDPADRDNLKALETALDAYVSDSFVYV